MMILRSIVALFCVAAGSAQAAPSDFNEPVDVAIEGYDGHAMEPFISRDGQWLFFNNRNKPDDQTDIHLAARIDDVRFRYVGVLEGTRSEKLDGAPSMDARGTFYFVSPRAYRKTRNTLWRGRFDGREVVDVAQLSGDAPRREPFWVNIDAEISSDGDTLYVAENRWRLFGGGIKSSNLLVAYRNVDGSFDRPDGAVDFFAKINTKALEFAPATTPDELTLYFTRVDPKALKDGLDDGFAIMVATRDDKSSAFDEPHRIETIRGYVEGPSVSPDGCAIYFHKRVDGVFRIQRAAKRDCA